MGFLKNIFNSASEVQPQSFINWISLTEVSQLEELIEVSKQKPIAIFKHSTRCGTSRMVLKYFEREFDLTENDVQLYFLDLLKFRTLSNEISNRFNVIHQSPQLIILKNGKVVYHNSHNGIDIDLSVLNISRFPLIFGTILKK